VTLTVRKWKRNRKKMTPTIPVTRQMKALMVTDATEDARSKTNAPINR